MEHAPRLCRSVLFTPGTRGDRVQKALKGHAADMVVADLEDAVAPQEKDAARQTVQEALTATAGDAGGPQRCVRINTWDSGWAAADLAAVVLARPHLIVVPKAEHVAHLVALDATLARLERTHGLPVGGIGLMLILETAAGVLRAAPLAAALPRTRALAFGAEDLAADAGLRRSRGNQEVLYARSHVALAAAAHGLDAIDQVFVDLEDTEGLQREAVEARALGYRGKMVLHPRQVAPVHAAFTPSAEEIEAARRLVDAAESADTKEGGVLRFEGRMIDVPLIEQARRVLAEARAAGVWQD